MRKNIVFIFRYAESCTPSSFATLYHVVKDFMRTMDIVKVLYNMLTRLMWMGFFVLFAAFTFMAIYSCEFSWLRPIVSMKARSDDPNQTS